MSLRGVYEVLRGELEGLRERGPKRSEEWEEWEKGGRVVRGSKGSGMVSEGFRGAWQDRQALGWPFRDRGK